MNDNSPQSLNNRPKRHLTYTNNTDSKFNLKMSASKKRRLNQLKSNRLSMSLTNENSMNQCNSPSSSSTSSMNIGKLKSSSRLNKSANSSSGKLIKSDKLTGKETPRLKRKSDQLKDRSGNLKARMVSSILITKNYVENSFFNSVTKIGFFVSKVTFVTGVIFRSFIVFVARLENFD